jgi:oxygen-dependent protoporphyrinogen oxidase
MMFGGPYWQKGYVMHDIVTQDADGKQKGQEQARKLLDAMLFPRERQHDFSFTNDAVLSKLHVQRDCIPTYTPGHPQRMFELHEALCSPAATPLSVIGASYTGVSLNDCVLYAKRTADRIVEAEIGNNQSANVSGLEEYCGE